MLRRIYYALSPKFRRLARKIVFFPVDLFDTIFNRREKFTPPRGQIYTGRGNFEEIGERMFRLFIKTCSIQSDYQILDVGSGIGRMARPFVNFLNGSGAYHGFDVVESGIKWCKKTYKNHPNFHFQFVPLHNDLYNLSTVNRSSDFSFPYSDNVFDFIIVTSVFTHMQEPDVKHYLTEIERVLKHNRYCFCTVFIVTDEVEDILGKKQDALFKYNYGNYFLHNEKVKDANVAYRYTAVQEMAKAANLEIVHFLPGWWPGYKKQGHTDYQDVIVLRKK
jgi:ubiquinone/menaquinone biosynthesis C-methylase UbiE